MCGIGASALIFAFASRPLVIGDRIGTKFNVYLSSIIRYLVMFMGRITCRHVYLGKRFLSREFRDTFGNMTREVQR